MNAYHASAIAQPLRLGHIITPETLRAESQTVKQRPDLEGFAIAASVPNWLITQFESPTSHGANGLVVFETEAGQHLVALIVIQSNGAQLRLVLPMGDTTVRAFLSDAMKMDRLQLWLDAENTKQVAMFALDKALPRKEELRELLAQSVAKTPDIRLLAQMMANQVIPGFTPSLLAGYPVTDVVAVLVGHRLPEQIAAAFRERANQEASATVLH